MDFVEHVFGISPNVGSGAYEALLLSLPFIAAAVLWLPKMIMKNLIAQPPKRHL
jgi:hypothetical protein